MKQGLIVFAREPLPGKVKNSLAAACDSGLTTALLPEWQGIDTVEDLHAYQGRNEGKP